MKQLIKFLLCVLTIVCFRFVIFAWCYKTFEDVFPDESTFYAYGLDFFCMNIPFWFLIVLVYFKWARKHVNAVLLCSYVPEIVGVVLCLRMICLCLHKFYFSDMLIFICIPSIMTAVMSYLFARYIIKKFIAEHGLI